MTDEQRTDRAMTDEVIAPAVLQEVKKYDKAVRVGEGLQSSRAARDVARKGGN